MTAQIRLLPVTVIAASLVLGLKVTHLFDDEGTPMVSLPVAEAKAEGDEETTVAAPAAETEPAAATEPKADEPRNVVGSLAGRDPTTFSPTEISLLENLAARRDEIETRARNLDVRENLLAATEQRIDDKIETLRKLEAEIEDLIKQHDAAELARLERLVKVYESMKPKDAARIFDQIEMDVLLEVASRMKEKSIAAVMAEMTPQRAQELTIALADRQDLASEIAR